MNPPAFFTECTAGIWQDFSDSVHQVNPDLANIIDELDPPKAFKLFKVRYPFGAPITQLGKVCLPDNTDQSQLNYAPTPLMLQLQNCSEMYSNAQGRIIPLNVFYPGDLLAPYEVLAPLTGSTIYPYWDISSGSRSVFLSPKVSNSRGHGRLRKHFRTLHGVATTLQEQWHFLKDIINFPRDNASPWYSEVLMFTAPWFKRQNDNPHWLRFYTYLLEQSWIQSKTMRINNELSPYWAKYIRFLGQKNYNPSAYIMNTLLHCLYIAHGASPGFNLIGAPNSRRIPNQIIEHAYQEVYGELKDAIPGVIAACPKHHADNAPLYYSLNYPTAINTAPEIKSRSNSHMSDLKQLQDYYELIHEVFEDDNSYQDVLNSQQFRFYHTDADELEHISSVQALLQDDPNIARICQRFGHEQFIFGPFFKGVIQICPAQ